jgi:AmpD protein
VHIDLAFVVHSISLPRTFWPGHVQQLFTNQLDWDAHPYFQSIRGLQVSAFLFITRTGELWQFVSVDDRAMACGASTYRGRDNCNDDLVGIELEGLEGGLLSPHSTTACARAPHCVSIPSSSYRARTHRSWRKRDSGEGFADWPRLQLGLGLPDHFFRFTRPPWFDFLLKCDGLRPKTEMPNSTSLARFAGQIRRKSAHQSSSSLNW